MTWSDLMILMLGRGEREIHEAVVHLSNSSAWCRLHKRGLKPHSSTPGESYLWCWAREGHCITKCLGVLVKGYCAKLLNIQIQVIVAPFRCFDHEPGRAQQPALLVEPGW